MSSRRMSLLPRATLHSDSEQVQYLQRRCCTIPLRVTEPTTARKLEKNLCSFDTCQCIFEKMASGTNFKMMLANDG
jgi:hypothetical protein